MTGSKLLTRLRATGKGSELNADKELQEEVVERFGILNGSPDKKSEAFRQLREKAAKARGSEVSSS